MFRVPIHVSFLLAVWAAAAISQPVTGTLVIDGSGRSILQIHNGAQHSVTAIVFTAELQTIKDGTPSEIYRFLDSTMGGFRAIPPQGYGKVVVTDNRATAVMNFRAAILDDNTISGDPDWGARITGYRQVWKKTITDLLSKLTSAREADTPLQDVIAQCRAAAQLAKAQPIPPGGMWNWSSELVRYTNEKSANYNTSVADNLANAVAGGASQAEAYSLASGFLRAQLR